MPLVFCADLWYVSKVVVSCFMVVQYHLDYRTPVRSVKSPGPGGMRGPVGSLDLAKAALRSTDLACAGYLELLGSTNFSLYNNLYR